MIPRYTTLMVKTGASIRFAYTDGRKWRSASVDNQEIEKPEYFADISGRRWNKIPETDLFNPNKP